MDFKRIRKSVVAGATAGVGAAVTYQVSVGWNFSAEHLGQTAGAFAAVALPTAWATWRVPNKPASTLTSRTRGFDPSAP